jgi:hypothetical protein
MVGEKWPRKAPNIEPWLEKKVFFPMGISVNINGFGKMANMCQKITQPYLGKMCA